MGARIALLRADGRATRAMPCASRRFRRGSGSGDCAARGGPLPSAQPCALRRRATVVSPGIEWEALSALAARAGEGSGRTARTARGAAGHLAPVSRPPVILWNHRWEFDKNAGAFFAALEALVSRGQEFRLV